MAPSIVRVIRRWLAVGAAGHTRRHERRALADADRRAVDRAMRDGRPVTTDHLTSVINNTSGWA